MRTARRASWTWPLLVAVTLCAVGPADGDEGEILLLGSNNPDAVADHPKAATVFEVAEPMQLTYVMTYHWHGGRGQEPGSVGLISDEGAQLGPWPATARRAGRGNAPLYWECRPDVLLPAGRWTVVDSHPESWSHNARSGSAGIAEVRAAPPSLARTSPLEALAQRDPAAALPFLDERIGKQPDDVEAYRMRAWIRFMCEDPEGAIADYRAAVRLAPEDPIPHRDLAFALMGTGRRREAAAAYGRALALAPGDPTTLLHRGTLLEILGETEAAAAGYRRILVLLHAGSLREDAAARLAQLSAAGPTPTPAPSNPSPSSDPGAILASGRVGPAGGRIAGPSGVALEFPAGAVDGEAEVVVRRHRAHPTGTSIVDVTLEGARSTLGTSVRVTLPMKPGLDAARVRPGLRVGEQLWIELPGAYDPGPGVLTFETPHFSTLGGLVEDTGNLKWAVGSGLVIVAMAGGGWLIAGSFTAAVAAAGATSALETLTVGAATLFFGKLIGDAAYDKTRAAVLGLDRVLAVPGFLILYSDDPENANAVPTKDWGTVVFEKESKAFVCFIAGRHGAGNFEDGARYTYLHVPWPVVQLAFELMATRHYYGEAGYRTRRKTVVYVSDLGTGAQGRIFGSWEAAADELLGGVLNVNSTLLGPGDDVPRRAMITHESWHSIARANGLADAHAAWVDEAVAWALEGQVFEGTVGFLTDRPWQMTLPDLMRGLVLADDEDPVKRGTFLWPFARYLLHSGGHEEIRDLVSGRLGGNPELLKQHWRRFARSLLTEEQQLADTYPQDPVVTTKGGKPIELVSGWQPPTKTLPGLDLNDLAPGPIQPGVAKLPPSLMTPRPLSLAMFRVLTGPPPPDVDGVPPPLVLRRATPTETEEYALLKPPAGRVSRPRAPNDVRIGARSVVAPGEWMKGSGPKGAMLTGGVVGISMEANLVDASPLWLYWLDAPRFDRIEPLPDNSLWTRLHWITPDPGGKGKRDLSPEDCYGEYRLLGFDAQGKATLVATTAKGHSLAPPGGKGHFEVSLLQLQTYGELGLQTVDRAARGDDGNLLTSPIRRFPNPATSTAIWPSISVTAQLDFSITLEGAIKNSGATDEATLRVDHQVDPATWLGRRHVETWKDRGMCAWKIEIARGDERLDSVRLTYDRNDSDYHVAQRFTLRDVPQIHVADLGPHGPVLRFYALKGDGLVKQVSEQVSGGSGVSHEQDPRTGETRPVPFSMEFKEWRPAQCRLIVGLASMAFEDVTKNVDAGLVTKEELERGRTEAMEAARAAFEKLGTR